MQQEYAIQVLPELANGGNRSEYTFTPGVDANLDYMGGRDVKEYVITLNATNLTYGAHYSLCGVRDKSNDVVNLGTNFVIISKNPIEKYLVLVEDHYHCRFPLGKSDILIVTLKR